MLGGVADAEVERQGGREAEAGRQRGKAEMQRQEAERQRGREVERQRQSGRCGGRETERQRGKKAERQRGRGIAEKIRGRRFTIDLLKSPLIAGCDGKLLACGVTMGRRLHSTGTLPIEIDTEFRGVGAAW